MFIVQNYGLLLLVVLGHFLRPSKKGPKRPLFGVLKNDPFFVFFTRLDNSLASLKHHHYINSSSTYIINSHHKTLQLSTTSKITILGVKKGSKMTPKTTPKNDPFLTLFGPQIHHHQIIIINVINTSSQTSKTRFYQFFNFFKNRKLFFKTAN